MFVLPLAREWVRGERCPPAGSARREPTSDQVGSFQSVRETSFAARHRGGITHRSACAFAPIFPGKIATMFAAPHTLEATVTEKAEIKSGNTTFDAPIVI